MKPSGPGPRGVDWERSQRRDRALDASMASLVGTGAKVLDLGCGSGDLLLRLKAERKVVERGVELHPDAVAECLSRGLSVIQADLEESLTDLRQDSFDVVILNQVVLVTANPLHLLQEALRVGRRALVSFPNFTWWRIRAQILFRGSRSRTFATCAGSRAGPFTGKFSSPWTARTSPASSTSGPICGPPWPCSPWRAESLQASFFHENEVHPP